MENRVLQLFNTLNRNIQPVISKTDGLYKIYTCGPTVYRDAHIGNLRSYLMADWIKRVLIQLGNDVVHIKNITDVGHMRQEILEQGEDKVVAAALAEGKTPKDIAAFYTNRFLIDENKLNILPADEFPKATDHVTDMVNIIKSLIVKGMAYEVNGNVYYDVNSFQKYGQLSGNINQEALLESIRIDVDPLKRNVRDFTLWKKAEDGRTLKWNSPWSEGFPGWHIECSAMSLKYLGEQIDIHTGGVDNIFPHHEGEIAQTEGFIGHQVVTYWVHGQHLLADGVKMAKSSGNAFILSELEDRNIDPLAFRYLCMTARYRTRINFTFASLKASEIAMNKLKRKYFEYKRSNVNLKTDESYIKFWTSKFMDAVCNDLDLPCALDIVWRMIESNGNQCDKFTIMHKIDLILGFNFGLSDDMYDVPDDVLNDLQIRSIHRANNNFIEADALRSKILRSGFVINDDVESSSIRYKSTSELRNDKWPTVSTSTDVIYSNISDSKLKYSIGIVVNGFSDDAIRCINSIYKYSDSLKTEILVIENGCDDKEALTLEELKLNIPNLKVIHADHRLGDAVAKNILIKVSIGKTFVFLDPSVEIVGQFLDQVEFYLRNAKYGVVGYAGLKSQDLLHFHEGDGESGEMDAMQGYCFAFRTNDLCTVGLMRESFRYYRNLDIDYSFQFKSKGFKIYADNDLPMLLHEHRGWTSLPEKERDTLSKKNYGRFLKKWRNRTDLLMSNKK